MPDTPIDPFHNAIWNALHSTHSHLALTSGLACKYSHNIAPFAAVEENFPAAFADLHAILLPGEHTWLFHHPPPVVEGLSNEASLPCLQMVFSPDTAIPAASNGNPILPITCDHSAEMVALTDIAFPGFFRPRTCLMGDYFCIRDEAQTMIAMGGERLCLKIDTPDGNQTWREISGICTHPAHRGHGYATQLIVHLLTLHRSQGAISALHVASSNKNAIALYHHLGFQTLREIQLHKVLRTD